MSGVEVVSLAVSLCKIAVQGGSKVIEQYKKNKLSDPERELLKTAAEKGEFYVLSADGVPDWLRVERKNFCDTNMQDPAISIKYLDAFKKLCERGYIYHDGGVLFRLTSIGFDAARKLSTK